jgi:tripartite-type tricarboxylate transporter receptor subunit TctC
MKAIRIWQILASVAAVAALSMACMPAGGGAVQQPARPVEFVISTPPGGGSDIYARAMQAIMEKNKLTAQPVQPVNREGGAGAVAFTHVFEKRGDMHYIMITLNSFFTTIITQPNLPYKATDFTPIANLALDPFFLWVAEDSEWKTAQDFLRAAKEREVTVSGTGAKQEDEILFLRLQELGGTKPFKYLPQPGGGQVAAALAGKQVEATVNNPSEGKAMYEGSPRRIRPVCAFTAERPKTGVYKDLATCKEQGLDISDYFIMRAVMGPPGLSPAQEKYWADVFKKVFDSQEWTDFMNTNLLDPQFKAGDDFRKFINDYDKLHRDLATKNKWV